MRELSLNVMDIAQNSISAGASLITIEVVEDLTQDCLSIAVKDNGRGMTPEQVQNVTDPFYTTVISSLPGAIRTIMPSGSLP